MIRILDAPDAAPVLFPEQNISKLLSCLRTVWTELKVASPVWWSHRHETTLVAGFFAELNNDERRMRAGIGFGHFAIEAQLIELDKKGMPKQVGRTDIRFFYAVEFGPELVLEFKRLDNKATLKKAYALKGVKRFGTGQYSPNADLGIMVGMVDGVVADEVEKLQDYLQRAEVVLETLGTGLANPSHLAELDFDTHHHRPACASQDIRVGHMLLER